MKTNSNILSVLLLGVALLLGACTKGPMDTPLLMGKGIEAYKVDLNSRAERMTQEELNAFNWAVEGVTYDQLIEHAPNKTPREVIRMAVKNASARVEQDMASAEKDISTYEEIRLQLKEISATRIQFRQEKTFFGYMPHLNFDATNASRFDVGYMRWVATIRVNSGEKPEATKGLNMNYRNSKSLGMKSNSSYSEQHKIGHVSGDYAWTTQIILQAKTVEVRVEPDFEAIEDLEGNRILPQSPYPRMEQLKRMAKGVELYGSI